MIRIMPALNLADDSAAGKLVPRYDQAITKMSIEQTTLANQQLHHSPAHQVAVACLGNSLRGDDGVAGALLAALPSALQSSLCLLDAGCYTADIPAFLQKHRSGVIIDACHATPGESAAEPIFVELFSTAMSAVRINSCHGLSWLDELILQKDVFDLPSRLLFVGIPVVDTPWQQGLSAPMMVRMPHLTDRLTQLLNAEIDECMKRR